MSKFTSLVAGNALLLALFVSSCSKEPVVSPQTPGADALASGSDDLISGRTAAVAAETKPAIYKAVSTNVSSNCGGYWEGLPANYNSTNIKYPLIINMTGASTLGNGSLAAVSAIKVGGPHLYLQRGTFPPSFTVNGENFSFIFMTPQYKVWPSADDINDVINYAISKYRIDVSRIYLMGFSMGGGLCWDYAAKYGSKAAAIIPICGASTYSLIKAKFIASSKLPVWAFHNDPDPKVQSKITKDYINGLNTFNASPKPRFTLFNEATWGHDAWSRATNAAYKEDGKNIYEWMLQFKR